MTSIETTEVEQLFAQSGWLRRLATSLAIDSEEGEDIYHETLVAAWDQRAKKKRGADSWLASVVHKKANRAHRDRVRRGQRESSVAQPETQPSTVDTITQVEMQRTVLDAVMALDEPYRTTVLLRFWEEKKPGQIATQFGLPVETVRTRIKRGLEKLRLGLDAQFGSRAAWLLPIADRVGLGPKQVFTSTGLVGTVAVAIACLVAVAVLGFSTIDFAEPVVIANEVAAAPDQVIPIAQASASRSILTDSVETPDPESRTEITEVEGSRLRLSQAVAILVHDRIAEIVRAQKLCQKAVLSDNDADGRGEFAYFETLSPQGSQPESKRVLDPAPFHKGARYDKGYWFQMFLPDANGNPIPEASVGGASKVAPDPNQSEQLWACYAWPHATPPGAEAGPVFFVDQNGETLVMTNTNGRYVGIGNGPRPMAAFGRDGRGTLGDRIASNEGEFGRDGEEWRHCFVSERKVSMTFAVVDVSEEIDGEISVGVFAEAGAANHKSLLSQKQALAAFDDLWLPLSGLEKTDVADEVTLRGRAARDAVIWVKVEGLGVFLPTRIEREGNIMTLQMPSTDVFSSARTNANESAAIATLKNIASSQYQCHASGVIDSNTNGAGEFGYFAELAGAKTVRSDARGSVGGDRISPPLLSSAFGKIIDSTVTRSGYTFRIYLPGADATWQSEAMTGGGQGVFVDSTKAELLWCCYAWPTTFGKSGRRAFFVNQGGDILAARNDQTRYSGAQYQPNPMAAYAQDKVKGMDSPVAANKQGYDGQPWIVVN